MSCLTCVRKPISRLPTRERGTYFFIFDLGKCVGFRERNRITPKIPHEVRSELERSEYNDYAVLFCVANAASVSEKEGLTWNESE